MLSLPIMLLVLISQPSSSPPSPLSNRSQELAKNPLGQFGFEQMLARYSEVNQRARRLAEETIDLFEAELKDTSRRVDNGWHNRRLIYLRERLEFLKEKQQVLERWAQQRKLNPDPQTDTEAIDRIERLTKEWVMWEDAWERGVNLAPMPREKK